MTKKSRYKKAADTLTQLLNEPGDYDEKVMKELDASPTTTDNENVLPKKSFADQCLERAKKFPFGSGHYGHDTQAEATAALNELDYVYSQMVPELAKRLNRSIHYLRSASYYIPNHTGYAQFISRVADELGKQ